MVGPLKICLDKLIKHYSESEFYREIYNAKESFFRESGPINEDDPDFENQMDIFMGWYLFDRSLSKYDLSPAKLFCRMHEDEISEAEQPLYEWLTQTIHSIFEVLKFKRDAIILRDISSKKKYKVVDEQYSYGFSKGDVFEARLVPYQNSFCFVSGFCFHPRESTKFIMSELRKIRHQDYHQRNELLVKFNMMKIKHMRYPHIDVQYVYTFNPKF